MGKSYLAEAGEIALETVTSCAFLIPSAWACASEMYKDQCDPLAVYKAGMKWLDVGQELTQAKEVAANSPTRLSHDDWKGDDRGKFEEKIRDYCDQLDAAAAHASVIGIAMLIVGAMLFLLVAVMCIIAVIIALCAAYLLLAMTTLFGYNAVYAQVSRITIRCTSILERFSGACDKVANTCGALIGTSKVVDVTDQLLSGNSAIVGDLKQSMADGLDNMLLGNIARLERDITSLGMLPTSARETIPSLVRTTAIGGKGNADVRTNKNLLTSLLRGWLGDYDDGHWKHNK